MKACWIACGSTRYRVPKFTHTRDCRAAARRREDAQKAWLAKWPNACAYCHGNTDCGYPCDRCLRQLICPRCGATDTIDAEDATIPCTGCGWLENEPDAGMPEDHECKCRVAVEKERQKEVARLTREIERKRIELWELERKARR
jgi:hypothetical protein